MNTHPLSTNLYDITVYRLKKEKLKEQETHIPLNHRHFNVWFDLSNKETKMSSPDHMTGDFINFSFNDSEDLSQD